MILTSPIEHDPPSVCNRLRAPDLGHWKSHCVDGCVNCRFAEYCLVARGEIVKLHDARAPFEYLRDVAKRKQTANCLIHYSPPPGGATAPDHRPVQTALTDQKA